MLLRVVKPSSYSNQKLVERSSAGSRRVGPSLIAHNHTYSAETTIPSATLLGGLLNKVLFMIGQNQGDWENAASIS
jgi:hypothetical protein